MKMFIQKINTWTKAHKIMSAVILLALIGTGYGMVRAFGSDTGKTRYVLASVVRGNIIASVTGSGQVSSFDQVDLMAKASGDLISVNVKAGQEVTSGAVIAQIDSGDAYYDLETAQLSYEKLVTINPDDISDAEEAVTDAEGDLEDAYTTARTSLSTGSTGMGDVMDDLKTLFNCNTGYFGCNNYLSDTARLFSEKAQKAWYDADKLIYEFTKKYRIITNSSTREEIEDTIKLAYDAASSVFEAVKYSQDAVVYFRNGADSAYEQADADEAYALVSPLISDANTVLTNLTSAKNGITDSKRTLKDSRDALEKLKEGADVLDIRSSELSVRQKQDALSDYVVRAPFAGIIASVTAKRGNAVNSGASIATIITKKKIAEISLNEIDVAKIKAGQKATLTFDAFEDLIITGEVAEVDLVGTVSQGVVNYTVKIAFDTALEKVKPGMTVNASIITDMKQNTLMVPTSAVKTQGGVSYVEVADQATPQDQTSQIAGVLLAIPPRRVEVTTGFTNDESIEIVSGLKEGQKYVARTVTTGTTAVKSIQTAPSLFGGGATGRPTGGNVRTFSR